MRTPPPYKPLRLVCDARLLRGSDGRCRTLLWLTRIEVGTGMALEIHGVILRDGESLARGLDRLVAQIYPGGLVRDDTAYWLVTSQPPDPAPIVGAGSENPNSEE